jgi:HD superfamily phosphodiesterase
MINRFARRKLRDDQEMEGRVIAKEILERLNVDKESIEEICDIIGRHHSLGERDTSLSDPL